MEAIPFCVKDRPFVCQDEDLIKKNIEFLEGVDAEYFKYVAELCSGQFEGGDRHRAATMLRIAYFQGLETLFALLCALVQSPHCIVGWMMSYKVGWLRALVDDISNGRQVLKKAKLDRVTWTALANAVHDGIGESGEKKEWVKKGFASAWTRFAHDFVDPWNVSEYNSIKHGMRAKPGGFKLSIGLEKTAGSPAPAEAMRSMGGSVFGSTFFTKYDLPVDKVSFQPRRTSLNWSPSNIGNALHLISVSVNNCISSLRTASGVPPHECTYYYPSEEDGFDLPWVASVAVNRVSIDTNLQSEELGVFSRDDVLRYYDSAESE